MAGDASNAPRAEAKTRRGQTAASSASANIPFLISEFCFLPVSFTVESFMASPFEPNPTRTETRDSEEKGINGQVTRRYWLPIPHLPSPLRGEGLGAARSGCIFASEGPWLRLRLAWEALGRGIRL